MVSWQLGNAHDNSLYLPQTPSIVLAVTVLVELPVPPLESLPQFTKRSRPITTTGIFILRPPWTPIELSSIAPRATASAVRQSPLSTGGRVERSMRDERGPRRLRY